MSKGFDEISPDRAILTICQVAEALKRDFPGILLKQAFLGQSALRDVFEPLKSIHATSTRFPTGNPSSRVASQAPLPIITPSRRTMVIEAAQFALLKGISWATISASDHSKTCEVGRWSGFQRHERQGTPHPPSKIRRGTVKMVSNIS
jgi:hypothetical protein